VLLHVRPLKGLQRMDDGSFVKDYESSADKEVEQVLQLAVSEVVQEDARTVERRAEELSIEFPERSKVFFLGERPYGAPAAVVAATKKDLAIEIAFFPNQVKENTAIHNLVAERTLDHYYPSYVVAKKVQMSGLALSKLTSTMLLDHNGKRVNVGLALKFEARSCKVLGYSRKSANGWEFSDKTVALVNEYKVRRMVLASLPLADSLPGGLPRGHRRAQQPQRRPARRVAVLCAQRGRHAHACADRLG
jgi:5'-3' exoribonuclease 1